MPTVSLRVRGLAASLLAFASLNLAWPAVGEALPAKPAARPSIMLTWSPDERAVGFRTIDKIFVTRTVKHGARVHGLPVGPRTLDVHFQFNHEAYSTESYMLKYRLSGVLVIKDGRIVLERYGLGRSAEDRWNAFSIGKSVTSTLVGAAVRDGFIRSLDDPVTRYLPEMAGSPYDMVSVRQLLTMSSGVRWTETYGDPNSDVVRIGSSVAPAGLDPIVSYMRALPRVAPPGTQFHYKSGEADLAGVLVSRATGRPLSRYLSEKIWRPFGMERDAVWIDDDAGFERGGCCLAMTLRDYGRYGLFMLGGGRTPAGAVVPDGWVAEATRKQIATGYPNTDYGYMWWVNGDGSYQAVGIFDQLLQVIPAEELVIVINAAGLSPGSADELAARAAFVGAVREAARDLR